VVPIAATVGVMLARKELSPMPASINRSMNFFFGYCVYGVPIETEDSDHLFPD
jgi:hypothetical protein